MSSGAIVVQTSWQQPNCLWSDLKLTLQVETHLAPISGPKLFVARQIKAVGENLLQLLLLNKNSIQLTLNGLIIVSVDEGTSQPSSQKLLSATNGD